LTCGVLEREGFSWLRGRLSSRLLVATDDDSVLDGPSSVRTDDGLKPASCIGHVHVQCEIDSKPSSC